jgi:AraC-like DNA-binding protein
MLHEHQILSIPRITVTKNRARQTSHNSARGIAFAQPLFEDHVYRFGIQERVGMHLHLQPVHSNYHFINFVLQGSITYECDGKLLMGTPGTLLFFPEGTKYRRLKIGRSLAFIDFMILPAPLWNPMKERGPFVRPYENIDLLYVLVSKVIRLCMAKSMVGRMDCLENAKMISSLLRREISHISKGLSEESRVEDLFREIRQKPQDDWHSSRLATELNISTRSLNRLCNKMYDDSPNNLVIRYRMEKAIELLSYESYTISDIANKVGYRNSGAFSNLFLKFTGMRPGEFRRKKKSDLEPLGGFQTEDVI